MVADIELVRGKLTELETYVRELEKLQALTLDVERVHHTLQHNPEDFLGFAYHISRYIETQST